METITEIRGEGAQLITSSGGCWAVEPRDREVTTKWEAGQRLVILNLGDGVSFHELTNSVLKTKAIAKKTKGGRARYPQHPDPATVLSMQAVE